MTVFLQAFAPICKPRTRIQYLAMSMEMFNSNLRQWLNMNKNLVTVYVCEKCKNWKKKVPAPELTFENKIFQVAGNDFYIDSSKIDDYVMTCHAIRRTKENGFLRFNNVDYEVKNNILYVNEEEIGDYKLAIKAIERAKELSDELSPRRCEKEKCESEGPFRISSEFFEP